MSMQIQQNVSAQVPNYDWGEDGRWRREWLGNDDWFDGNTWLITHDDFICHYSNEKTARASLTSRARKKFGWEHCRTKIVKDGIMMQCYNGAQRTNHYTNSGLAAHQQKKYNMKMNRVNNA